MFITAYDKTLTKELYFKHKQGETDSGFVVSRVDFISTPGVAYVSVDPSYLRPVKDTEPGNGDSAQNAWFNGGNN
jgi:hypothetical protein